MVFLQNCHKKCNAINKPHVSHLVTYVSCAHMV